MTTSQKLGARMTRNEQDEVVGVSLAHTQITDTGLVHIEGGIIRVISIPISDAAKRPFLQKKR